MRKQWLRSYSRGLAFAMLLMVGMAGTALATSSSDSYQVTETQFGSSNTKEACSGQYCAKASLGDIAVGGSTSTKSTAQFGTVIPDEPLLEVIVDAGVSDLGVLTTEETAAKVMVVRVRSYLSNGYFLQVHGSPPKYQGHTLAAMSSLAASTPGVEQFGINVVKNTSPGVGEDVVQVPSSQVSFGMVEDDYKTPNLFKYVNGDTVARSSTASGRTDYTVSMIINIAENTPAGHYATDFSAVVVPFY